MIEGTNENFKDIIKEDLVLVQFHATWCGPCKMIMPITKEIADEGNIKVMIVDIDENIDIVREYGIMSVPTLLLFVKGKVKAEAKGYMPKDLLLEWINKNK